MLKMKDTRSEQLLIHTTTRHFSRLLLNYRDVLLKPIVHVLKISVILVVAT